jgi:hypothetical protein
MQSEKNQKILKYLDRMNYWQLMRLEDSILLKYESLFKNSRVINGKTYYEVDTEQVKWSAGKIFIIVMSLIGWLALNYLIFEVGKNVIHKIFTQSIIGVFLYLGTGVVSVGLVHFLWQKVFTPFARTLIRGVIHYWPATIVGIYLLKTQLP